MRARPADSGCAPDTRGRSGRRSGQRHAGDFRRRVERAALRQHPPDGSLMSDHSVIDTHLRGLSDVALRSADALRDDIVRVAAATHACLENGGKLMFCGNGGSAADAQHIATEYVVRFQRNRTPMAAVALTTDTSLLTAASNDFGFDNVFERQVQALGKPGDILFLHSTSGESRNLLLAAAAARAGGVTSIALVARTPARPTSRSSFRPTTAPTRRSCTSPSATPSANSSSGVASVIEALIAAYHAGRGHATFYRALSSVAEDVANEEDIEALNG